MYVYTYKAYAEGAETMRHVTLTELRSNMAKYFDQVVADRDELIVTRQNHEPVVIMPLAELEGLRETLHLLSSPANAEHLLKSIADANAGKLVERELIEP
jgi:antitoxin YefM